MAQMLNRRTFLAAAGGTAFAQRTPRPPNVIVILADDLGYGDLGCYGSNLKTPNLDRMAREGVRFLRYDSANPVCSPSRAALLTGRYPTRVGVPRVLFPYDKAGLPATEITMAQMLKDRGYKTKCVGKWHLGHMPDYLPMKRGFDSYFGIPYSNDMNPRWLMRNDQVIEEQATLETLTPRYTDEAVKFIAESKASPFFLYMPHTYPHIPLAASAKFRGKSPHGIYGDVIEELDWSVGEIFAALKKNGVEKNTLVMFTSDNGPWYQGSAGLLRGRKGNTWEGGVREPFIAWMPGRIPAGKVQPGWASAMDVFPTVAKLCGGQMKNQVDGIDIWPLMTSAKQDIPRDVLLYFDNIHMQCARLGNWKLHFSRYNSEAYSPAPQGGRQDIMLKTPELYDLAADPQESYDAADKNPRVVADIQGRVDKLMAGFPENIRKAWEDVKSTPASVAPAGAVSRAPVSSKAK